MTSTFSPEAFSMARGQLLAIHRLPRRAGGKDTHRDRLRLARHRGEIGHGLGGSLNRLGPQPARLVEALPQPRLVAPLANRLHLTPRHIGHQQLHGVGADIYDRAADRLHMEDGTSSS